MKKIFVILLTFIIFFCIYFLQANFFNWFTIAGIKPNIFIIFALILGLFLDKAYTPILCISVGLIFDFFCSDIIGMNSIMLGIAAIIGGILNKNFSTESKLTIMLMVIGTTLICEIIAYILKIIMGAELDIIQFLKIIFIEGIYNVILTIILYPLVQKFGSLTEKVFSKDKIFTRYF